MLVPGHLKEDQRGRKEKLKNCEGGRRWSSFAALCQPESQPQSLTAVAVGCSDVGRHAKMHYVSNHPRLRGRGIMISESRGERRLLA